jgi:hypothetical protein
MQAEGLLSARILNRRVTLRGRRYMPDSSFLEEYLLVILGIGAVFCYYSGIWVGYIAIPGNNSLPLRTQLLLGIYPAAVLVAFHLKILSAVRTEWIDLLLTFTLIFEQGIVVNRIVIYHFLSQGTLLSPPRNSGNIENMKHQGE